MGACCNSCASGGGCESEKACCGSCATGGPCGCGDVAARPQTPTTSIQVPMRRRMGMGMRAGGRLYGGESDRVESAANFLPVVPPQDRPYIPAPIHSGVRPSGHAAYYPAGATRAAGACSVRPAGEATGNILLLGTIAKIAVPVVAGVALTAAAVVAYRRYYAPPSSTAPARRPVSRSAR